MNGRLTPEELIQNLRHQGLEPKPYSGRFMYGKECVSVSFAQGANTGKYTLPPGWSTDQQGKGTIFYWPHSEWPKDQP